MIRKYWQYTFLILISVSWIGCNLKQIESKKQNDWVVEIVQDGEVISSPNQEYRLQKNPFTIRIRLPKPHHVQLNVLNKDDNFKRINPDLPIDSCPETMQPFCIGMGFSGETGRLYIDEEYGEGHLFLYYENENDHNWDRVEISETQTVFERDVFGLVFQRYHPNEDEFILLQSFTGPRLYLVFLVNDRDRNLINEGELKKIILSFE